MPRSVIVVGAGIAGLTAAYHLSKADVNVAVLEASDRVGGRMTTDRHDGYVIDRGAQFLSDGYLTIGELISELGLASRLSRVSKWVQSLRGGTMRRISARYPWTVATSGLLSWRDAFRMARATVELLLRTKHLPLHDYSQWHALDDMDAAKWILGCFGENALEYVFEPIVEGLYFQAPEDMSRAWPAIVWSFGARRKGVYTLEGGLGCLPEAIAENVAVSLNTPAQAIDVTGSGVSVRTPSGSIQADHVVLATTTSVSRTLYDPADDVERRLLDTGYSTSINVTLIIPRGVGSTKMPRDTYGILIPRRERRAIASIAIESRKSRHYAQRGELLNVMLSGSAARRLLHASETRLLAEFIPELQQFFPRIDEIIEHVYFHRWPEAEPRSPVGRSRDIHRYRGHWHPGKRVILAGDYMGLPCVEGAAESGKWAARALTVGT